MKGGHEGRTRGEDMRGGQDDRSGCVWCVWPVVVPRCVRVDHVMESRDVMNIHVVEHSILNGIEYCTFWFRSVVEMTRHQLLLHGDNV
jgi:hypothetical protein